MDVVPLNLFVIIRDLVRFSFAVGGVLTDDACVLHAICICGDLVLGKRRRNPLHQNPPANVRRD